MNIGAIGRWILRQTLGTKRGGGVILALESGMADAVAALGRGDVRGFLAALPAEMREQLLRVVMGMGGQGQATR